MPLSNFRQICLPYCIRMNDDKTWSVLNREYQPLGFAERVDAPPANLPIRYDFKGLGPKKLREIAHNASEDGRTYWLYDDGCVPESSAESWDAYARRLKALTALQKKV